MTPDLLSSVGPIVANLEFSPLAWALLPALPLFVWFLGGLALYAAIAAYRGQFRDADMEAKGRSAILGFWIRRYFVWVTRPLWRTIVATGLPANAITTLATLLGIGSGFAFAAGKLPLGGWLYIFSGILDVFDGRLARSQGTSSKAGAVLDSVLDRYVDAAALAGLAWFYRDSWMLVVCLLALAGGLTVSYVRARAEGVGVQVSVGLMQRPERVLALGLCSVFAPVLAGGVPIAPLQGDGLVVAGACLLAVSTQVTGVQRLLWVLQRLTPAERPASGLVGKSSLLRGVIVAGAATAADFVTVTLLVQSQTIAAPWLATAVGCGVGAVASFTLGRLWGFSHSGQGAGLQFGRYAFVSLSGMGLNAAGVWLLQGLALDYRISWAVVRGLTFLLWSFPLHRNYVFQHAAPEAPAPSRVPASAANGALDWPVEAPRPMNEAAG